MKSRTIYKLTDGGFMVRAGAGGDNYDSHGAYPIFACTEMATLLLYVKEKLNEEPKK